MTRARRMLYIALGYGRNRFVRHPDGTTDEWAAFLPPCVWSRP